MLLFTVLLFHSVSLAWQQISVSCEGVCVGERHCLVQSVRPLISLVIPSKFNCSLIQVLGLISLITFCSRHTKIIGYGSIVIACSGLAG